MEELENGNSQTHPSDPHLHDDFLEQMLSTLPNCSWPDLSSNPSPNPSPNPNPNDSFHANGHSASSMAKSFLLQQQLLLSRGVAADSLGSPLHDAGPSFKSPPAQGADGSVQALFNGCPGPLQPNAQTTTQQPFQAGAMPAQNLGAPASASTGSGQAPQRQRVRARRGQATDPHSIAERLRRERIAERMKALQELVPNGNKTDKASMLDEIIDYVKFLQLQVKVLSMSRLGGASAAAPRVAHLSSEGQGGGPSSNNGNPGVGSSNDGMSVTEHQVVKLMEEDMGSAMQYLQGKGLCLMPISLATAISTATCNTRNNNRHPHPPPSNIPPSIATGGGPSSPNLSNLVNGDGSIKDSNPPSKA